MSRTVKVEKVEEADAGLDAEFAAALELDAEPDPEGEPEVGLEAELQAESPEERPSWLPDRFRSPEALVESYGEAQRKITEQGVMLSELAQENAVLREERLSIAERVGNLERAYLAAVGGAR